MADDIYTDQGTSIADEEIAETRLVITLKKPLAANEKSTITELHLVEPTCGQWLKAASFVGPEAELQLLAMVAKVPATILRELAISDFVKATSFLAGFARPSPPDGPRS